MTEEDIDLKKWEIIKSDIFVIPDDFDESILTEDLFQIRSGRYIVDAGWYCGIRSFITYLIKDMDWDNPIIKVVSKTKNNCLDAIDFCIKNASSA